MDVVQTVVRSDVADYWPVAGFLVVTWAVVRTLRVRRQRAERDRPCPACDTPNPPFARFCRACGKPVR